MQAIFIRTLKNIWKFGFEDIECGTADNIERKKAELKDL
jgi:hypothetical protein